MRLNAFRGSLGLCALGLLACQLAVAQPAEPAPLTPPKPPAESFYKLPDLGDAELSPSGRWLAVTVPARNGRVALAVFEFASSRMVSAPAMFSDADVEEFHWVGDDWLVIEVGDLQRGGADQPDALPRLVAVRRDGSLHRELVSQAARNREQLPADLRLLHVPNDGSGDVIVGHAQHSGVGEFESLVPRRVNVETGRLRSVGQGAPAYAHWWWFDADGQPRAVLSQRGARASLHWRAPGSGQWQRLFESDRYDTPFWPHSVDGQRLYVTQANRSGDRVLKRYDFERGAPEAEPLVSTPGYDFAGGMVSEAPGARVLGVRLLVDAETTHWFDPRMKELQALADKALPGRVNRLTCVRCDEPGLTLLVRSFSDRDPGHFWVYTAADGKWLRVGARRKDIDPRWMGTTDLEHVSTRDGKRMPVWVTRPARGVAQAGPLPTVVLVHGGPWVRGRSWNWDANAQFLASRGYLVIEPEFRGSRGYGYDWYRAGWREWGRAMQDDVADALLWATRKGWADPERACIAGASYGGYATLMGLVRHPELYRCGVAWVAVTDPRLMFKWRYGTDQADTVREVDYPRLVGDPVADAERLNAVTPVLQAEHIRAPLMLAMGAADRRVLLEHGLRMRKAMADVGRPLEWVLYDDEGHGWYKLGNRLDFARRLEAFLAKNLGKP